MLQCPPPDEAAEDLMGGRFATLLEHSSVRLNTVNKSAVAFASFYLYNIPTCCNNTSIRCNTHHTYNKKEELRCSKMILYIFFKNTI